MSFATEKMAAFLDRVYERLLLHDRALANFYESHGELCLQTDLWIDVQKQKNAGIQY